MVRETLQNLNIHHVTTSVCNPKANGKVERFHRTLHDILAKRLQGDQTAWDLHLNQVLAAIRFNVSEATEYSPYYLLYGRDVVLPVDNLLRPRQKYQGEDMHKISLQEQHKAFMLVNKRLRKQQRKQERNQSKNRKDVQYQVGDPVYWKKYKRDGKLGQHFLPFYRVIEQKSPVTYVIRNQLDGTTENVHAEHMARAKIEEWQIPKTAGGLPRRRAAYVVPPTDSDESSQESSDSEPENPRKKLVKLERKEREDSGDEEDIPLMELATRLRERQCRIDAENKPIDATHTSNSDACDTDDMSSQSEPNAEASVDYDLSDSMMVDEVRVPSPLKKKNTDSSKSGKFSRTKTDKCKKIRLLVDAIAGMF